MKTDGIIFDMDGTIWDTLSAVCLAWNEVFAKEKVDKIITTDELSQYMGLPMTEIALRMFPGKKYQEIEEVYEKCMTYENEYIASHGAVLYDGLIEMLERAGKIAPLFIVSNCQSGYIESFFKAYNTAGYFKDYECFGNTRKYKTDNIKSIVARNNLKNPVYVGDTQGDCDSSREAGVPFIYAQYGFGKVKSPDYTINTPLELLDIIS